MNKDQFLQAANVVVTTVEVPNVGTVHLRSWTGKERRQFQEWFKKNQESDELNTRVALLSLSDEHGKRLFQDNDFDVLENVSCDSLQTIMWASMHHNKFSPEAIVAEKKRLGIIPNVSTPTDSPKDSAEPSKNSA